MPPDSVPAAPPCVHLRAKVMYVPSGVPADDDEEEPALCWCNRTLRELGPDGDHADTVACSDPVRACYQNRADLTRQSRP